MPRKPQDPRNRINEILDAAEQLFTTIGYRKTTIGDIAGKLGVAQGMLYYYFKSKEEVLEELIKRQVYSAISKMQEISAYDDVTPPGKISLLVSALLDGASYKGGLLLKSLFDEQNLHIRYRLARQIKLLITPILLAIIGEGVGKQCFRVPHQETAKDYILNILDLLIEALYEKTPADQFSFRLHMGETLLEKVLDLQVGSICLLPEHSKPGP